MDGYHHLVVEPLTRGESPAIFMTFHDVFTPFDAILAPPRTRGVDIETECVVKHISATMDGVEITTAVGG